MSHVWDAGLIIESILISLRLGRTKIFPWCGSRLLIHAGSEWGWRSSPSSNNRELPVFLNPIMQGDARGFRGRGAKRENTEASSGILETKLPERIELVRRAYRCGLEGASQNPRFTSMVPRHSGVINNPRCVPSGTEYAPASTEYAADICSWPRGFSPDSSLPTLEALKYSLMFFTGKLLT